MVENNEKEIKTENTAASPERLSDFLKSILFTTIIIGGLSGYVGAKLANNQINSSGRSIVQTKVQEDSSVIEAVKKSNPAVVSIIISKKLSQLQTDNSNPFFLDPFFGTPAPTAPQPNSKNSQNYTDTGAGSGFIVTADGLILTNKHVVSDAAAKYTVFTNDGKKYDASVVATDPLNDIALVKIDIHDAPTLNLADSAQLQLGQRVIAIGNSLGQYRNTVTTGIVSGIGRNITAGSEGSSEQLEGVIQTDAAINPGNSGGPLLDLSGNVVGINTAIDQQGQSVGFAIPSSDAKRDIDSYRKNAKITRPFLGVKYILITSAIKDENNLPIDSGAWITGSYNNDGGPSIIPGSAAADAGIKEGDIITTVNGTKIDPDHSLASIMKYYNPGDIVNLDVLRDGKNIKIAVKLGEFK